MFRSSQNVPPPGRRGIILLVVLSLLTLFAIVGLTFAIYAESAAEASRATREVEDLFHPDVDPELALAEALSQIIYDVPDDETGCYSALRGHSLARLMYGFDHNIDASTGV